MDIEKYTNYKLRQNLLLLEEHLKDFETSPMFCADCIKNRHILVISGLISECKGAQCALNPTYEKIDRYIKNLEKTLPTLTKDQAIKFAEEARDFRKELEHMGEKEIHLGDEHLSNPGLTGKELLLHAVPYLEGSPGIVVDEASALASPCHGARFDTSEIIFSKGIVGALDEKQKVTYCKLGTTYEEKGALVERIKWFKEAIAAAKERYRLEHKPGITRWLALTGEELRKRGIEL